MTFTDCVRCLTTFTHSRFNSDVSLNAIAFLRFCAVKLADGGLVCKEKSRSDEAASPAVNEVASDLQNSSSKDDHTPFWIPLLTGLSRLISDPRSAIRNSALKVLFNILNDHGHLFSHSFWMSVFDSVIHPIFNGISEKDTLDDQHSPTSASTHPEASGWDFETSAVAAQCLVDLFVSFFSVVRPQLPRVISIVTGFIKSPVQGPASTGVAALLHLAGELGGRLSEDEWKQIFVVLKEGVVSTLPGLVKVLKSMDDIEILNDSQSYADADFSSDHGFTHVDLGDDYLQTAAYVASRVKSHIAVQLLIVQVATDLYKAHAQLLSVANVRILLDIFSSVSLHAGQLNSDMTLQKKLQNACSILELSDPPIVHFENESYQNYLNFLQNLLMYNWSTSEWINIEPLLMTVCEDVLQIYLKCGGPQSTQPKLVKQPVMHWILPPGSAQKEEFAARTSLLVSALRAINDLPGQSFRRYISQLFPLLVDLVQSEHSSGEVQQILCDIFQSCIGPIVVR